MSVRYEGTLLPHTFPQFDSYLRIGSTALCYRNSQIAGLMRWSVFKKMLVASKPESKEGA